MIARDITGEKFNKLTAIRFDKTIKKPGFNRGYYHFWIFKCDCGSVKSIRKSNVIKKNSTTTSCGCVNTATRKAEAMRRKVWEFAKESNTTHGLSRTKFSKVFNSIKQRCNNHKNKKFHLYGGAGIKCCWHNLSEFKRDMYEDYVTHVEKFGEKNTTIDRIDCGGNYSRENCRWVTYKEQNNNLSTNTFYDFCGRKMNLCEISKVVGINPGTLYMRLKGSCNGDINLAVSIPVRIYKKR